MKDPKTTQVGGSHYGSYAIQPIEFIMRNRLGFAEGCVIKYICRFRDKNGLEDLDKAIHYIEFLKASYKSEQDAANRKPIIDFDERIRLTFEEMKRRQDTHNKEDKR